MMISIFDREENTVGKDKNAGNQHFLLFPQCFLKAPSLTFYHQQNFRLVQIESICRRQIKYNINLKFVLGRKENMVGKGGNAGYQHFLLFPPCFQKASFTKVLKVGIMWQRVKVVKSRDCVVKS